RFAFPPADAPLAQEILHQLTSHLLAEEKLPSIVRLTDIGYQLLQTEINEMRAEKKKRPGATGDRNAQIPPTAEEVTQISIEVGGADFVYASRLEGGRFVIKWATEGLERVTGYSVQALQAIGGWPTIRS